MATITSYPDATEFDPTRYAKLIGDRTTSMSIEDILSLLEAYQANALHLWRRVGKAEGGYGPMGMPAPDYLVDRGGATPRPFWYLGPIADWLIQTGRLDMITFLGQQPRFPGRGAPTGR